MRAWDQFARRHREGLTIVGVALFPLVALADRATGSLVHVYILYFLPVVLLSWVRGYRAGLASALASFGLLLWSETSEASGAAALSAGILNAGLRGVVLVFVAGLVSRAVSDRAFLERRVGERTEALRDSEARWQSAVEGNADGLWDCHIPSGKVHFSRMWKAMLGYAEDEIGDHIAEFSSRVHPDDRPANEQAMRDCLEGRTSRYASEFRIRCADGSWKWILGRGSVVDRDRQGRPLRAIGTHTDISRRKQMEGDLTLFKAVIEASNEAVGIADATGRVVFVNRAHERLFGPRKENLRHYFPAASVEILDSRVAPALARGESGEAVLDAFDAEGRIFPLWSRSDAVRDADGAVQWIFGIMHDLTEARRAEAELRASVKEKQALLMEVHHRVKNNLQVITSLLRLESARAPEPATRAVLKDMQSRITAMALLHETVYKSESFAAVDLSSYLTQLASQFVRAHVREGTVQPRMDFEGHGWSVTIDQAVTCGLLVSELMTNTLKHAFPGGRTGEMRIALRTAPEGAVRLTVSDNGVGLPPDFASRQLDSLGLQLVTDLARQLGGPLEVLNEGGASFSVTFQPRSAPVGAA